MQTHNLGQTTFSQPGARELQMTRVFDAPRELVWDAYTKREHISRWWGQRDSETIVDKQDARPGGEWRYVQKGQDGAEYGFHGEFLEVSPPDKLVYTFEFEGMPGHVVTDSLVFEEVDGKTRIVSTSTFVTEEDLQGMVASGMESGANESWERLAELLATLG